MLTLSLLASVIVGLLYVRQRTFLSAMFGKSQAKEITSLLKEYLTSVRGVEVGLKSQQKEIDSLASKSKGAFERIGFFRFNPFKETGGDQSFVLALLNEHKNGVVITSLHGRNQTRIFAKEVSAGKTDSNTFSDEERTAVETACVKIT